MRCPHFGRLALQLTQISVHSSRLYVCRTPLGLSHLQEVCNLVISYELRGEHDLWSGLEHMIGRLGQVKVPRVDDVCITGVQGFGLRCHCAEDRSIFSFSHLLSSRT